MILRTTILAGALGIAAAAQGAPAAPPRPAEGGAPALSQNAPESGAECKIVLGERTARFGVNLETPENLHELKSAVEQSFGVKFSIEPLPEQCAGAAEVEAFLDPFSVFEGERFGDVVVRLEAASKGRWIFEEFHGVPLLRPDSALDGHGTLLDTVVSADIEASSMWDALCALARAVNRTNAVHAREARPLLISFADPALLRHPPPMFIQEKSVQLTLKQMPAREGLCAIFAQVGENIRYSYTCVAEGRPPRYDYISINAFDDRGKVVNGGKMRGEEYKTLMETVDWMSVDDVLAAQAPLTDSSDEENTR